MLKENKKTCLDSCVIKRANQDCVLKLGKST